MKNFTKILSLLLALTLCLSFPVGASAAAFTEDDPRDGVLIDEDYLHVQDPVRQSAIAKFEDAFFEKPQEVHRNIIEFVKSS